MYASCVPICVEISYYLNILPFFNNKKNTVPWTLDWSFVGLWLLLFQLPQRSSAPTWPHLALKPTHPGKCICYLHNVSTGLDDCICLTLVMTPALHSVMLCARRKIELIGSLHFRLGYEEMPMCETVAIRTKPDAICSCNQVQIITSGLKTWLWAGWYISKTTRGAVKKWFNITDWCITLVC